jgi:hypothetical protein
LDLSGRLSQAIVIQAAFAAFFLCNSGTSIAFMGVEKLLCPADANWRRGAIPHRSNSLAVARNGGAPTEALGEVGVF